MSAQIDDGGPAFPEHHYFDPGRGQYGMHMTASDVGCGGMTLRDWFAGQALAGEMVAGPEGFCWADETQLEALTKRARLLYRFADAMIEARKGGER